MLDLESRGIQLGIILRYGDNLHIGELSLFSEISNVKNSCIPPKIKCPSIRGMIEGMSPVLETNMSPIRGTFSPSGQYEKMSYFRYF